MAILFAVSLGNYTRPVNHFYDGIIVIAQDEATRYIDSGTRLIGVYKYCARIVLATSHISKINAIVPSFFSRKENLREFISYNVIILATFFNLPNFLSPTIFSIPHSRVQLAIVNSIHGGMMNEAWNVRWISK